MRVADLHDFFVAAASVAGALIGLLFVAISVSQERLAAQGSGQLHRVRAAAALTSFSNALVVSMFGLLPTTNLGAVAFSLGLLGLGFVVAALLSLRHIGRVTWAVARDLTFLAGLTVMFVVQLVAGLHFAGNRDDSGSLSTIATIVIVCFLVGIARAWELIGAPSIGLSREVTGIGRETARRAWGGDDDGPRDARGGGKPPDSGGRGSVA